MQKPNSFDDVNAGGEFTPIETGGHHALQFFQNEKLEMKRGLLADFPGGPVVKALHSHCRGHKFYP